MADLFDSPAHTSLETEGKAPRPLADRLRPRQLDEVVGQEHILAPGAPLGDMLAAEKLSSLVLWGPPGSGKTTIARLLAVATEMGTAARPISDSKTTVIPAGVRGVGERKAAYRSA